MATHPLAVRLVQLHRRHHRYAARPSKIFEIFRKNTQAQNLPAASTKGNSWWYWFLLETTKKYVEDLLKRLKMYTKSGNSGPAPSIFVEMMAELPKIVALVTKQIKQGQLSEFGLAEAFTLS
ncbi:hypothetical protein BC834DRAFT_968894 [Gloeopeniophorella convolvens]|nr:hypothetical protein BC834DRAFT_968894 [Gloeopeniophorella convolvens]